MCTHARYVPSAIFKYPIEKSCTKIINQEISNEVLEFEANSGYGNLAALHATLSKL